MCLILFANNVHPRYRLVMAANRDEFYERPTAPLDYWHDHPEVLAGRDLLAMGTWMGITRNGRMAAVTNYRAPSAARSDGPSRGGLVAGCLLSDAAPVVYLERVGRTGSEYGGFNLIAGDPGGLYYYSNHNGPVEAVAPGIHGLSNHFLDTPWPKIRAGLQAFGELLSGHDRIEPGRLIELLQDQTPAPDDDLPSTGVGIEWERLLSPIFITSATYGTRSSSVLLIEAGGRVSFCEQTWQPARLRPTAAGMRCFELHL